MYPTERNKGEIWEFTDLKGRKTNGIIKNIARMRYGAVLCFMKTEKGERGFPITKHGTWKRII